MNILLIDNSVAFTGAFKCALNEAELLSSEHHFVFIIPHNSTIHTYLEKKGIKYYKLRMPEIHKSITLLLYPLFLIINIFRTRSIVKKEKIDIVQCNDFYNLIGAGLKFLGYRGKLITYVRFIPSVIPSPLRKLWTGLAQKYSFKVIAVSDTVLKQLPHNENTIRIYDPANLIETFTSVHQQKNTIQLLYLSNYIRGKGQDYALEAFIRAYAQNPDLRLKFTGGDMGLEKNKQFRNSLEQKAEAFINKDIIQFAPFNNNVEAEIKAADILLNFSNAESLSMTCLEASYYGTPVIATRCGGPEEVIVHNSTGLLVPVADIDAMTNAILELAADNKKREAFAQAGKDYIRKKFSIETFIATFNSMLKS